MFSPSSLLCLSSQAPSCYPLSPHLQKKVLLEVGSHASVAEQGRDIPTQAYLDTQANARKGATHTRIEEPRINVSSPFPTLDRKSPEVLSLLVKASYTTGDAEPKLELIQALCPRTYLN